MLAIARRSFKDASIIIVSLNYVIACSFVRLCSVAVVPKVAHNTANLDAKGKRLIVDTPPRQSKLSLNVYRKHSSPIPVQAERLLS